MTVFCEALATLKTSAAVILAFMIQHHETAFAEDPEFSIPFGVIIPQCAEDGEVLWDKSNLKCLVDPRPTEFEVLCNDAPPIYHPSFVPPQTRSYLPVSSSSPLVTETVSNYLNLIDDCDNLKDEYVPRTVVLTG